MNGTLFNKYMEMTRKKVINEVFESDFDNDKQDYLNALNTAEIAIKDAMELVSKYGDKYYSIKSMLYGMNDTISELKDL